MNNNLYGEEEDLVLNTSARIPVCLCIDTSGSMVTCVNDLNKGVADFYKSIRSSDAALASCEVAIVSFGSTINVLEEFSTIDKKKDIKFVPNGKTDMTGGVNKTLQLLNRRKEQYKQNGVEYFQPWLVLFTDGTPDDTNSIIAVQETVRKLEAEKKLTVFCVGIGGLVDMDILGNFSKKGALKLKDNNFSEFFEWLGKSVSIISNSIVGQEPELDTSNCEDWAEL
ncbi:MAG: VWA domain-containing protein [bacterium]